MESSDVLPPVPSAALFSPGDVASVSSISSGTLFTDFFGLSLRLIIRGKMTLAKRAGRKKRVAKGIVYGKPETAALYWNSLPQVLIICSLMVPVLPPSLPWLVYQILMVLIICLLMVPVLPPSLPWLVYQFLMVLSSWNPLAVFASPII